MAGLCLIWQSYFSCLCQIVFGVNRLLRMDGYVMDDAGGCLLYMFGICLAIAAVVFVIWLIVQVAVIAGIAMGSAGVIYGGGQACRNYGIAFKRNVIESNRA